MSTYLFDTDKKRAIRHSKLIFETLKQTTNKTTVLCQKPQQHYLPY